MYLGISCLRADWHAAQVTDQRDSELVVTRLDETSVLPETGIFAELEPLTDLTRFYEKSEAGGRFRSKEEQASRDAFDALEGTNVGECYDGWLRSQASSIDAVGISHPYGLSPAVRRALPALVDGEPFLARDRVDRDAPHCNLKPNGEAPRLCALETPLAVALELVAKKRVEVPSVLVIVSPGSSGFEVTILDVGRNVDRLMLSVTGFGLLPQNTSSVHSLTKHCLTKWNGGNRVKAAAVIHVGTQAADPARRISELIECSNVIDTTESDAAAGVARYAVLCVTGHLTLAGANISGLDCQLIAPHAIGICCRSETAGASNLFWCPIIEAGDLLTGQEITVQFSEPFPDEIVLAECVSTTRGRRAWVVGTQDLRWHSLLPLLYNRDADPQPDDRLSLRIHSSAGCLRYGWSDPFARIELRP